MTVLIAPPHGLGRRRLASSFVHVAMGRSAVPAAGLRGDGGTVSTSPIPHRPATLRVLIVDADRRVRRDLTQLVDLEGQSLVVGAAGDPASAIEMAERLDPDVVVLDPRLPDVDAGLGLIARLHRDSVARIVVLCHDAEFAPRARAVGADRFLTKGGQLAELLEAITGSGDEEAPGNGAEGEGHD